MKNTDGRRAARVENQEWIDLRWIDSKSFDNYLKWLAMMFENVVYLFSGTSLIGNIRVDINRNSNATLFQDAFTFLDNCRPGIVDCFIADPPKVLYEAPGKPQASGTPYSVWEASIKNGTLPVEMRKSELWGHNMLWQGKMYELLKPGGLVVTKRNTVTNCNTMAKIPLMWYVHDARPSAFLVRIDKK